MTTTTIAAHQNHTHWQKEHDATARELAVALECQNTALTSHLESIGRHQANVLQSEQMLAECERSMAPALEASHVTEQHVAESQKQAAHRDVHERIKRHCYSTMATVTSP